MAERTTTEKLPVCKQCGTNIARGDDQIACEGFCHNAFHARCAKLSADTLLSCRTNPCVWWICGPCSNTMRTMRNDQLSRANQKDDNCTSSNASDIPRKEQVTPACNMERKCEDAVRDLTEEMSVMKQQLAAVRDSMDRIIAQRENSFELSACVSSSPLSSTKLMRGSRRDDAFNLSCNTTISNRFWLFFTKIKNTTTEREIYDMVSTSLGYGSTSPVIVKKLVPFGMDTSTMQYISFKVGIDPALKDAALTPSTWPVGICYRQFIDNVCY